MNSPSPKEDVSGNYQYPTVILDRVENPTNYNGILRGGYARLFMGILQIIFGAINCLSGIVFIFGLNNYIIDYVWVGVFCMLTGFLGVFSLRKKSVVTAYMITSIMAGLLCAGFSAFATRWVLSTSSYYIRSTTQKFYMSQAIIFFIEAVITFLGACFTCVAFCSPTSRPQQNVYYTRQPFPQVSVPTSPNTVVAS